MRNTVWEIMCVNRNLLAVQRRICMLWYNAQDWHFITTQPKTHKHNTNMRGLTIMCVSVHRIIPLFWLVRDQVTVPCVTCSWVIDQPGHFGWQAIFSYALFSIIIHAFRYMSDYLWIQPSPMALLENITMTDFTKNKRVHNTKSVCIKSMVAMLSGMIIMIMMARAY